MKRNAVKVVWFLSALFFILLSSAFVIKYEIESYFTTTWSAFDFIETFIVYCFFVATVTFGCYVFKNKIDEKELFKKISLIPIGMAILTTVSFHGYEAIRFQPKTIFHANYHYDLTALSIHLFEDETYNITNSSSLGGQDYFGSYSIDDQKIVLDERFPLGQGNKFMDRNLERDLLGVLFQKRKGKYNYGSIMEVRLDSIWEKGVICDVNFKEVIQKGEFKDSTNHMKVIGKVNCSGRFLHVVTHQYFFNSYSKRANNKLWLVDDKGKSEGFYQLEMPYEFPVGVENSTIKWKRFKIDFNEEIQQGIQLDDYKEWNRYIVDSWKVETLNQRN